ncbi:MAG: hypothetical protein EA397_06175 [Deltaproteobacteria bacterium]|nr:MAG: hypothetical protein EA397_06175 [Deltaproteobacteria bacterium]
MRFAHALLALLITSAWLLTSTAYAGGVGVFANGGTYQERLYYHRVNPDADPSITGPYKESQMLPMGGLGLELILGDRDDRIIGIARVYYQAEGPQPDPSANIPGRVLVEPRDSIRHVGVFSVGLQGGLIGDPEKAQLTLVGLIGSGFLTFDHTEFVFGELGVGGTVRLNRNMELFGNAMGHLRFRKWGRGGVIGATGIRFLFD